MVGHVEQLGLAVKIRRAVAAATRYSEAHDCETFVVVDGGIDWGTERDYLYGRLQGIPEYNVVWNWYDGYYPEWGWVVELDAAWCAVLERQIADVQADLAQLKTLLQEEG